MVQIEISLDAKGVTEKIAAIKTELEALDDDAGDIDLGNNLDLDGVTGDVDELIESFEELDNLSDNIGNNLSQGSREQNLGEMFGPKKPDSPDGSTNKGDSTGNDPPNPSNIIDILRNFDNGGGEILEKQKRQHQLETKRKEVKFGVTENILPEFAQKDKFQEELTTGEQLDVLKRDGQKEKTPIFDQLPEDFGLSQRIQGSDRFTETLDDIKQQQKELFRKAGLDPDKEKPELTLDGLKHKEKKDLFSKANVDFRDGLFEERNLENLSIEEKNQIREASDEVDTTESLTAGSDTSRQRDFNKDARKKFGIDFEDATHSVDLSDYSARSNKQSIINSKFKQFEGGGFLSGVNKRLSKLKPSMKMVYNVMAAMIPIAVVLGAQMLGVAAAMGAVGVAGASIIGLGLVGHGESMESSFANATEQLQDLKQDLFDVSQPTMQLFAPIQARAFDRIPGRVDDITEAMEGLTAYEDTLFRLGGMLSEGMVKSIDAIVENEQAISSLATQFASLAGSAVVNFFSFLFKETLRNRELLISFGNTLKDLAVILFRVFRVVVRFLNAFSPLIDVLLVASRLLNTTMGQALFGFIAAMYLTISVLGKLGLAALKAYGMMAGGGLLASIQAQFWTIQAGITRLIAHYTALSAAAASAAATMAMTGVGLLAVGAGAVAAKGMMENVNSGRNAGSGNMPGGNGRVYNDNRTFNIRNEDGGGSYQDRQRTYNSIEKKAEGDTAQSESGVALPK